MNRLKLTTKLACPLVLTLLCVSTAWACPGCKDALSAQEGGGDLVAGYFWSILFMMSMPFILVASFGGSAYVAVRRARKAEAARRASLPQPSQPQPAASPANRAATDQHLLEV